MRVFNFLYALLFFIFFDPLSDLYTLPQCLYITSIFLVTYFFASPKAGSKNLFISSAFFTIIYSFYFVISKKSALLNHITDIRTYLIDKQLLFNYNTSIFETLIAYYQQLIVACGVIYFLTSGRWRILGLVVILFEVLTTGTRSFGIFIIVSLLIYYSQKYKWDLKHYLVAIFSLIGVFYLSEIYSYTRSGYVVTGVELASTAISYSKETTMALNYKNDAVHFEDPFVYMASGVIPRAIWQNKPMSKIVEWYTMEFWGFSSDDNQGTVLPGLIGQLFLGSGWFGVVEMFLFLWVCSRLVNYCKQDVSVQALFYSGMILSLRMITLSNFLPFFISIFLFQWKRIKLK